MENNAMAGKGAQPVVTKSSSTIADSSATSSGFMEDVSKLIKCRVIAAYWILGMCNNYIYVIMLSAAHDIISKVEYNDNSTRSFDEFVVTTTTPATAATNESRHCNDISTGTILLADIIPTLLVKLLFPFLPFLVHARLGVAVTAGVAALLLVGLADNITIILIGVCFASFQSGLGEITLLAYSTLFPLYAVAAWSSGTGGAGVVGAFAYAGMIQAGLTPEVTLFVSILFPILMATAFWLILKHPPNLDDDDSILRQSTEIPSQKRLKRRSSWWKKVKNIEVTMDPDILVAGIFIPVKPISSKARLKQLSEGIVAALKSNIAYLPKLLPFMIPVGSVYYFEYLINSGLFELLVFDNTWLDYGSQFRWYNVMYQVGVFVSRSSVSFIHFKHVWVMSVLQAINLVLLTLEAIYGFIPNVWIMFLIIFWEGLLGGAAYVNTFYNMSYMIPKERRLFALSIASVADTFGIVSAGLSSLPVHSAICKLPHNPYFRWPSS